MNLTQRVLLEELDKQTPKKIKEYDLNLITIKTIHDLIKIAVPILAEDMPIEALRLTSYNIAAIASMGVVNQHPVEEMEEFSKSKTKKAFELFVDVVHYRTTLTLIHNASLFLDNFEVVENKKH